MVSQNNKPNINFSIVIPHYGDPKLLERLIASIPVRKDLEVLVTEDKEQRGAGWARNKSLERANGRWVIFADSDDTFLPDFNTILDNLKDMKEEMVFFHGTSINENTGKPSWRTDHLQWFCQHRDCETMLRHRFTEPWCRAVRRELISRHNIVFSESHILDDILFTTKLGVYAKSVAILPIEGYCVHNRKDSTGKQRDTNSLLEETRELARANRFRLQHGIMGHSNKRMMRHCFYATCSGQLSLAQQCWQTMRNEGYSNIKLIQLFANYPTRLVQHVIKRFFHYRNARN